MYFAKFFWSSIDLLFFASNFIQVYQINTTVAPSPIFIDTVAKEIVPTIVFGSQWKEKVALSVGCFIFFIGVSVVIYCKCFYCKKRTARQSRSLPAPPVPLTHPYSLVKINPCIITFQKLHSPNLKPITMRLCSDFFSKTKFTRFIAQWIECTYLWHD